MLTLINMLKSNDFEYCRNIVRELLLKRLLTIVELYNYYSTTCSYYEL